MTAHQGVSALSRVHMPRIARMPASGALVSALLAATALLPAPAAAADLGVKAPVAIVPPGSWTGFYAGAYAGAALVDTWSGPSTAALAAPGPSLRDTLGAASGAAVGGQAGYNYQIGAYVLGVEADIGTGSLYGLSRCGGALDSACTTSTDLIGTLAARLGFPIDRLLVYGKAGLAIAHDDHVVIGNSYPNAFTGSETRTGWTAGAGIEVALAADVSAKAEYAYLDFGSASLGLTNGPAAASLAMSQTAQMVKVGVNWHPGAVLPGGSPQAAGPVRDWSGLYLGVHAGGAWGRDAWSDPAGLLAQASQPGTFPGGGTAMGLIGGGQAGFNVQFGSLVAGMEATVAASTVGGYAKCASNIDAVTSHACRDTVKSLGTLAGRVGHGFGDALVYAKGGAAWASGTGNVHHTEDGPLLSSTATRWGWMLGVGIEHAMMRNVSAFVEYDHLDFGSQSLTYAGGGQASRASLDQTLDMVRMGINYRFGTGTAPGAPTAAPALPQGWTAEIGARYFASTGRMQKDLFATDRPDQLNSRLIYGDTTGQAVETFFRFETNEGLFLKGFAGLGTLAGGKLFDEDFPPENTPYSDTIHALHAGSLAYGAVDLGFDFLRSAGGSLGAFVGYRGFYNSVNGYGCSQVGPSDICETPERGLLTSLALGETESWQGVALGLNARLALADRLRLEVDAAYLPYVVRGGFDNHWHRSDINPIADSGHGWGTQVEAILTYAVTDRFDVGVGGRYWFFATDAAATQFPLNPPVPAPMTFQAERYGAFLQAAYRFGDAPAEDATAAITQAKSRPAPANWTGFYAGGSLGGGKGASTYASPFPTPVRGDGVDLGGALAGLQLGGDFQMGALVLGAEASAAWSNAIGTNTCFSTVPTGPLAQPTGFNCGSQVKALGTVTGRIGYAFDRTLAYARGGFAWDRQHDMLNTAPFTRGATAQTSTNAGWTAGAGIEYALLPTLSVGVEYRHFDFGASSPFTTARPASLAGVDLAPASLRLDMVAMTLNYRFWGAGPQPQ